MSEPSSLQLLERHLDLLPSEKQPLARWLCEGGAARTRFPGNFRQRFWRVLPVGIYGPDGPKRLVRELVLERLAKHRREVGKRRRVGAGSCKPVDHVVERYSMCEVP